MRILAAETSTLTGSIALVEALGPGDHPHPIERILAEYTLNIALTHSERLMAGIDRLLADTSLTIHQVQGIALSIGPGSFTGLRIGASTMKGLAYALGVPVVGVPTLDALAQNMRYASGQVCPILDARKKEVYAALFRGDGAGKLVKVSEDWVLSPDELCSRITEKTIFLGNGVEIYGEFIRQRQPSYALLAPPEFSLPRSVHVACLAIPFFQKGKVLDLFSFTPTYLRRSEAEIHREIREQQSPSRLSNAPKER